MFRAGAAWAGWAAGIAAAALAQTGEVDDWPQWRGPLANGVAPSADPPVVWHDGGADSAPTNIRWKVAIPGRGVSTPVVRSDRIYLTTAVDTGKPAPTGAVDAASYTRLAEWQRKMSRRPESVMRFCVLALDRADGRIVWQTTVTEEVPHEGSHSEGTWASNSAIADGERVYAFFGSRGLYCLTSDGRVVWSRKFGAMAIRNRFGEGASPCLWRDRVIVNWDHEGPSFITALDAKTGAELWRTDRAEITSWSTPLVVSHAGRDQIVVNATRRVRAYDPRDGALLWECDGTASNAIPSVVAGGGLVFATANYRDISARLLAIRLDAARGDVAGNAGALAWSLNRDTPYVSSPLLYDGLLYFARLNDPLLSCHEAAGGAACFTRQKLPGLDGIFASPIAASGRIYVTGRNGATAVLAAGREFRVLAVNTLADRVTASPAAVGRELFIRGAGHLYCIAQPGDARL